MTWRLDKTKYMNIGNERVLNKLNILLKDNNQHKEDLLNLYHFILDEPGKLNEIGITESLWVCYNSIKLIKKGLERYPTDIKYIFLNGKSRVIQSLSLLKNMMSTSVTKNMNEYQISEHKRRLENLLNKIGLSMNEIELVLDVGYSLDLKSNETKFLGPNKRIKELIHRWVFSNYYIENIGLIGIGRYWKKIYKQENDDILLLKKVFDYVENDLLGVLKKEIGHDKLIKESVKDLEEEIVIFKRDYQLGKEGKTKCIEQMKRLMLVEMYVSPGDNIL